MDFAYMQKSTIAACRLAVRDPQAWNEFDLTTDGFFRSFMALLLVAPLNILFDLFVRRLAQTRALSEGKSTLASQYGLGEMLFSTATLAIEWLIFPLAALFLLRLLNLSHRYGTLVIAHNWGRVVTEFFNLPTIFLFSLGLISHQSAFDLLFITLGLTLYYRFYIAQSALEVGWGLAMGIAILELLLTIFFALAVSGTRSLWLPS